MGTKHYNSHRILDSRITGDVTFSTALVSSITAGSIVNADVSNTAAIHGSKINPDFSGLNVVGKNVTVGVASIIPKTTSLRVWRNGDGSSGTATLSGGYATVASTLIESTSIVFVTYKNQSNAGILSVDSGSFVDGVSFDIESSNGLDDSEVYWFIVNETS